MLPGTGVGRRALYIHIYIYMKKTFVEPLVRIIQGLYVYFKKSFEP